jgi:hypothetical protein
VNQLDRAFDSLMFPDSAPAIAGIFDDGAGHRWVSRWRPRDSLDPVNLDVIDASGEWLGTVVLPATAGTIMSIGADHVMTVWLDSEDVSYVRLFRIRKP